MSRRLLSVSAVVCALALGATVAQGALVGYWPFDDGQGTTVKDASGNGHDGTIVGTATWVSGAPGFRWGLQFDGSSTAITCGTVSADTFSKKMSIAVWVKFLAGGAAQYQGIVAVRNTNDDQLVSLECSRSAVTSTTASLQFGSSGKSAYGLATLTAGTWTHIVVTVDASTGTAATTLIVNGGTPAAKTGPDFGTATAPLIRIGSSETGSNQFCGVLDDVRIYNSILTQADVGGIMYPPAYVVASNPSPASGATDVLQNASLSWTAGTGAVKHDVYFGTNAASLTKVATGQTATTYTPAAKLALATTYYWRIDEVNAGGVVQQGDLWKFASEPVSYALSTSPTVTASSTASTSGAASTTVGNNGINTANDQHGTTPSTMWLSDSKTAGDIWIQYQFDKVYKLDQMWVWNFNSEAEPDLGVGFADTTIAYSVDGTNWTTLYPTYTMQDGTALTTYACNNKIDMKSVAAKYVKLTAKNNIAGGTKSAGLSEVRFYWIPAYATSPSPATSATGVRPDVTLSWRPGRTATVHKLYFGTDKTAVTNGKSDIYNLLTPTFTPGNLPLDGATYYWRVDEFNPTETPATWTGDVLSFTTAKSIVIDDMESYTADVDHSKAIYQKWIDGVGTTTNGSQVGYRVAPFTENVYVHGGTQAMPFSYNNAKSTNISEATITFATAQDWTLGGASALAMFVRPDVNNAGGQLYLKVNGVRVSVPTFTLNLTTPVPMWKQWTVSLSDAADLIPLNAVKTLTIGVSGAGKGVLYIDDIALYLVAPTVPVAMTPSTTGLLAYYAMSNNVKDSSGKGNDGTIVGAPTFANGVPAFGTALQFNGTTDCVDIGNKDIWNFPGGSFTVSFWANIGAWGTAWNHVMMGNRGEDSKGWQVRRGSSTGVCFTTRGVGGTDDLTGTAPALNQWIHIACVYDNVAGTKALYINGNVSISGTTTVGAKLTTTTHDTYLGCRANSGNTAGEAFFTGMLDEIRIYSRALVPGEVYSLAGGN
jgi:hypothetical protein